MKLRKLTAPKKAKFVCQDGPFERATLYLTGPTAFFRYRGEVGRYITTASGTAFWKTKDVYDSRP